MTLNECYYSVIGNALRGTEMTIKQIAAAIAAFATDLENSITMEDRRDAVQYLADKIGPQSANQIAETFGVIGSYYKA